MDEDRRVNRQDVDQVHHHQGGGCVCKTALQGFKGVPDYLKRIMIELFTPDPFR